LSALSIGFRKLHWLKKYVEEKNLRYQRHVLAALELIQKLLHFEDPFLNASKNLVDDRLRGSL